MLRAALATAGAHEADVRDAIQEVLHTQGAAVVAGERGYGRLRLGGVLQHCCRRTAGVWVGHAAGAVAASACEP